MTIYEYEDNNGKLEVYSDEDGGRSFYMDTVDDGMLLPPDECRKLAAIIAPPSPDRGADDRSELPWWYATLMGGPPKSIHAPTAPSPKSTPERLTEDVAREKVTAFLWSEFFGEATPRIVPDGDTSWAFFLLPDDRTSYVKHDGSIEWLGTEWSPYADDEDEPDAAPMARLCPSGRPCSLDCEAECREETPVRSTGPGRAARTARSVGTPDHQASVRMAARAREAEREAEQDARDAAREHGHEEGHRALAAEVRHYIDTNPTNPARALAAITALVAKSTGPANDPESPEGSPELYSPSGDIYDDDSGPEPTKAAPMGGTLEPLTCPECESDDVDNVGGQAQCMACEHLWTPGVCPVCGPGCTCEDCPECVALGYESAPEPPAAPTEPDWKARYEQLREAVGIWHEQEHEQALLVARDILDTANRADDTAAAAPLGAGPCKECGKPLACGWCGTAPSAPQAETPDGLCSRCGLGEHEVATCDGFGPAELHVQGTPRPETAAVLAETMRNAYPSAPQGGPADDIEQVKRERDEARRGWATALANDAGDGLSAEPGDPLSEPINRAEQLFGTEEALRLFDAAATPPHGEPAREPCKGCGEPGHRCTIPAAPYQPRVGERVRVPSLGGRRGTVTRTATRYSIDMDDGSRWEADEVRPTTDEPGEVET